MSFQLNFTGFKQKLSKKNLPSTKAKFYDLCKIYLSTTIHLQRTI